MAAPRIGASSSSFLPSGSGVRVFDAPAAAGAFLFALRSLRVEAATPIARGRAKARENFAKILGQGGLRPHRLPGPGMREAQAARVKHLARRLDARRRKVPPPVDQ